MLKLLTTIVFTCTALASPQIQEPKPRNTQEKEIPKRDYDDLDRVTKETFKNGRIVTYLYKAKQKQPIAKISPQGKTTFEYNEDELLASETDPKRKSDNVQLRSTKTLSSNHIPKWTCDTLFLQG